MKKSTIITITLGLVFLGSVLTGSAQMRHTPPKTRFIAPMPAKRFVPKEESIIGTKPLPPLPTNKQLADDPILMMTRYDLQTNASDENRIYLFPDGTMGGTSMLSHIDTYVDRGTGYNYFNGGAWGAMPDARLETQKTGWPSYAPFGATGEIVVTHTSSSGLMIGKCPTKGTNNWTFSILPGPTGAVDISWPRVVTNGTNHNNIHILAETYTAYQGMTNQLLYFRSLDGGTTWGINNFIIPGIASTDYANINPDSYTWADPHGDTLAFVVGDSFMDEFLMKSLDNGTTWTKTVIYHSPYNLGGTSPHWFYCPDGTSAIALDTKGTAHVVFGLQYDSGVSSAYYWTINMEGIAYWNENMPQLNPNLIPDTLIKHHQYVAWVKDTAVFSLPMTEIAYWYSSLTSNPQLVIDKDNKIFLSWAGATSLLDPSFFDFRHIYGRDGVISGDTVLWHNDTLIDITSDWIQYNFADCVYPSASPTTDDNVYILFQKDDYAGSYMKGNGATGFQGQTTPSDNSMTVIKWPKDLWVGAGEKHQKPTFSVGQNFPNPVSGETKINVYIQNPGDLSLTITNVTGQIIFSKVKTNVVPGVTQFVLDGSQFNAGVYFYTLKQGNKEITKKMIVQ